MAISNQYFEVDFGLDFSGLSAPGYRLYQDDGTDSVARTTTGVFEINSGSYGVVAPTVPDNVVGIDWEITSGSTVYYAREDIDTTQRLEELSASAGGGGLTPGQVTAAVWDAQTSDYEVAGSFGEKVGKKLLTFIKFIATKDA